MARAGAHTRVRVHVGAHPSAPTCECTLIHMFTPGGGVFGKSSYYNNPSFWEISSYPLTCVNVVHLEPVTQ